MEKYIDDALKNGIEYQQDGVWKSFNPTPFSPISLMYINGELALVFLNDLNNPSFVFIKQYNKIWRDKNGEEEKRRD